MRRATNRNTHRKLFLACGLLPVLAAFNAPEDKVGGGGGGGGNPDDPTKKKPDDQRPQKLEMTQEELDRRIGDALKRQQEELDRKAAEQKKKDEEEASRKKGEFERLYNDEVVKAKAKDDDLLQARLTLRREQVTNRLRRHVAEKHAPYLPVVDKYMAPLLAIDAPDLSDADADKQVAAIVEQYVKDNPRDGSGGGGVGTRGTPPTPHRGKASGDGNPPTQQQQPAPRRGFRAVRSF